MVLIAILAGLLSLGVALLLYVIQRELDRYLSEELGLVKDLLVRLTQGGALYTAIASLWGIGELVSIRKMEPGLPQEVVDDLAGGLYRLLLRGGLWWAGVLIVLWMLVRAGQAWVSAGKEGLYEQFWPLACALLLLVSWSMAIQRVIVG